MYRCAKCNKTDDFELAFSTTYTGNRNYKKEYNSLKQLVITVDSYKFVPDLKFMNEHAVCKFCGSVYNWTYE